MRVDLPGGGWAVIKDPTDLTNRERRVLRHAVFPARALSEKLTAAGAQPDRPTPDALDALGDTLTADDLDLIDGAQAAFIVVYTAELHAADGSSLPLPTLETVDDLPGPIFDALAQATVNLGDGSLDVSPSQAADPASPTGPSPG